MTSFDLRHGDCLEGMGHLPDASIDRVLAVHSLEMAANARDQLREIWRVLAPGGRVILVVPNRRGLWARGEATPLLDRRRERGPATRAGVRG